MAIHVPVLLNEAIEYLNVKPNKDYIDATFGGGGYTKEILVRSEPKGKVLAIDWDESAIDLAIENIEKIGFEAWIKSVNNNASGLSSGNGDRSKVGSNKLSAHNIQSAREAEPPSRSDLRPASEAIKAGRYLNDRLVLLNGNFAQLKELTSPHVNLVAGIVFDFGLRSDLLEFSGRGFSFKRDEPLLMNYESRIMNQGAQKRHSMLRSEAGKHRVSITAREVVNTYSKGELERIFKEYGEIRQARKISSGIIESRKQSPIRTTFDLRKAVEASIKSATPSLLAQVWQAIRIEVNDELKNIEMGLKGALDLCAPGGRIVAVSFHSLEDRIVKNFLKEAHNNKAAKILTKKPVVPSEQEIKQNPRARSAKLRAVEIIQSAKIKV